MRTFIITLILFWAGNAIAQKLPHGTVFGRKPGTVGLIQADKLDKFMGKSTRIPATVGGRITLITKAKGGWFDMDAGNGKIITAHFANANITLPANLKGRYIIMQGVAQKKVTPLLGAKNAGKVIKDASTSSGKQMLFFEVKGLMVDK